MIEVDPAASIPFPRIAGEVPPGKIEDTDVGIAAQLEELAGGGPYIDAEGRPRPVDELPVANEVNTVHRNQLVYVGDKIYALVTVANVVTGRITQCWTPVVSYGGTSGKGVSGTEFEEPEETQEERRRTVQYLAAHALNAAMTSGTLMRRLSELTAEGAVQGGGKVLKAGTLVVDTAVVGLSSVQEAARNAAKAQFTEKVDRPLSRAELRSIARDAAKADESERYDLIEEMQRKGASDALIRIELDRLKFEQARRRPGGHPIIKG